MRFPRRIFLAAAGTVVLLLPPVAPAHVTLNPTQVAADSFARFDIRVPNERPDADTTKVTIQLPQGLFFVSFQPKPGWRRTITMAKLAQPVDLFGDQLTERVATVTWEGGAIKPGEFDEFGMSAKVPNRPGSKLVFPSLQTYSSGEVVRWIGPPDADEPAPRVSLGARESENPPQPTSETTAVPAAAEEDGDGTGRANVALGLGIAGLIAGLAALGLGLARRRT